jgi:hypothetical protein
MGVNPGIGFSMRYRTPYFFGVMQRWQAETSTGYKNIFGPAASAHHLEFIVF